MFVSGPRVWKLFIGEAGTKTSVTVQRSTFGIDASDSLRSSEADDALSKVAVDLTNYGLTPNQARIFLQLTVSGPSTARPIYESLRIHKVDAYRNLQALESAGLVEVQMGSPAVYSAREPVAALSILLKKKQDEVTLSRGHLAEMASEIRGLKQLGLNWAEQGQNQTRPSFRLGQGGEGNFFECKSLVEKAETEVLRISGGVFRTDRARILLGAYVRAKNRGVSLRIITQINATHRAHFKKLSKVVSLRHMEVGQLRLSIVDRNKVLLHTQFPLGVFAAGPREDCYLVIEDEKFAEGFATYFERLWAVSKPVVL